MLTSSHRKKLHKTTNTWSILAKMVLEFNVYPITKHEIQKWNLRNLLEQASEEISRAAGLKTLNFVMSRLHYRSRKSF